MNREMPLNIKLIPTSTPTTQAEAEGQLVQISNPRISAIMPSNSTHPELRILRMLKYRTISITLVKGRFDPGFSSTANYLRRLCISSQRYLSFTPHFLAACHKPTAKNDRCLANEEKQ
jgi:hypothetical protein